MFVIVRYGEDKSKIFNSHCKNGILLETMKIHCGCGKKEVVEVCDERGLVKNLRNHPTSYGSDFLKERETLVLLTVHNTPADKGETAKPVFTPLLASLRDDKDFNDTLNQEKEPEPTVNSPATGRRRQQHPGTDADDDAVSNKSFKAKVKAVNGNLFSSSGKKSILRRSTKSLFRK
ncbi:hypothetical protein ACOMHN_035154 [Nucella lapillus]